MMSQHSILLTSIQLDDYLDKGSDKKNRLNVIKHSGLPSLVISYISWFD